VGVRLSDWTRVAQNQLTIYIFYENESAKERFGTGIFIHKGIISAVKNIVCDILNVCVPTEDKSDDTEDCFL
jgi:hypothetical protein